MPKMEVMASKMSTKMVNLREIKKDHTLFRNDFFKANPFQGFKLIVDAQFVVKKINYQLSANIDFLFLALGPFIADLHIKL